MSQDQQTTSTDERVIVPVAPERSTGMAGSPIVIDLRSASVDGGTEPDHHGAPDGDDGAKDDTVHDATDDTNAASPRPYDTPAPKAAGADPQHELQFVTVEDLTDSIRALRRENAQLTAVINTMRANTQAEIAARDRMLVEAERSSQQAMARATSQLAAAHMQIDFSSVDSAGPSSERSAELTRLQEAHAIDRAALSAELEELTALHHVACQERDNALAARDEMVGERDRVIAALDESAEQRNTLKQQLAAAQAPDTGSQTDEAAVERDRLTERLAQAASDREALQSQLADAHSAVTERDTLVTELKDLAAERDALQDESDRHAEQLRDAAGQHEQIAAQLREVTQSRDELADTLHEFREASEARQSETPLATAQLHAALAERDREQAVALHARDTELEAVQTQLQQTRAELQRAHEALAGLSDQDHVRKVDELTAELATARADLDEVDERVQRAFEAGSQLGERAAERLARLLPADSN